MTIAGLGMDMCWLYTFSLWHFTVENNEVWTGVSLSFWFLVVYCGLGFARLSKAQPCIVSAQTIQAFVCSRLSLACCSQAHHGQR